MVEYSARPRPPALLSRSALAGIALSALFLLGGLLPFALRKQVQAALTSPSALSLLYLRLSVLSRPSDCGLRMQLARKQLQARQLTDAHTNVVQVIGCSGWAAPARELLLEVNRARWAATDPRATEQRTAALRDVLSSLKTLSERELDAADTLRYVAIYRELAQPRHAAELLDRRARSGAPEITEDVSAAEAAWLAAGSPLVAAELHAVLAERAHEPNLGLAHARRALVLARASDEPGALPEMLERVRAVFPHVPDLLELAVLITEAADVQRAYLLASQLVSEDPNEPRHRRVLARLAEATGHPLRALDEYVWLWRRTGRSDDRMRALALARAQSDLPLVRELLDGERPPPKRRGKKRCQAAARTYDRRLHAEARERVALYEALGDTPAAIGELARALSGEGARDESLWRQKLELELRLGDAQAALLTLATVVKHFERREWREQLANLQLGLGKPRAALRTLRAASGKQQDEAWLRLTAVVAFEVSDDEAERATYRELAHRGRATRADYQRLLELARDHLSARAVALEAFERFPAPELFTQALELLTEPADESDRLALLAEAERFAVLAGRPDYWHTRIGLHQARCARAADGGDYDAAKAELEQAEALLGRAQQRAPAPEVYTPLWNAQHAQALALGLASDDKRMLARIYNTYGKQLSLRERVHVLAKLGRDESAWELAREGLESDRLSNDDRRVLSAEVERLGRTRARYVRSDGDALGMEGLFGWRGSARVEYGDSAAGIRGEASYGELHPRLQTGAPAIPYELRDVTALLRGQLAPASLEFGVLVRNESMLRPFGTLTLQLSGNEQAGVRASVAANAPVFDTARLRALAVRQAASLDFMLPLGARFALSARTAAEAYYTQKELSLLGYGITIDAGLGANFDLGHDLGRASLRILTRVAPRFAEQHPKGLPSELADGPWLPATSEWVGFGASFARGRVDVPPGSGREACYILDGAIGWLWPQSGVGYRAQAGFGVSLLGGDLLSVLARAGNVESFGRPALGASVAYALSWEQ